MKPGRSALKIRRSVKIDLSWRVWSLIVGFFILIGFVGLSFAIGGTQPSVMGHSYGELGIPTNCLNDQVLKYNSSSGSFVCGVDSVGGSGLPGGCSNNQTAKWVGSSWICANDVDTKCSTSNACSQLCIGTDCKTSWPASAICTFNGRTYSTGIVCSVGQRTNCYPSTGDCSYLINECESNGAWSQTSNFDSKFSNYPAC